MKSPILTPLSIAVLLFVTLACVAAEESSLDASIMGRDGALRDASLQTACDLTAECADGLFCDFLAGTCATDGGGTEGAACGTTADCVRGLLCDFQGSRNQCTPAGSRREGQACTEVIDCQAGLACFEGFCATRDRVINGNGNGSDGGFGGGGDGGFGGGDGGFGGGNDAAGPASDGSVTCSNGCDDGIGCTIDQCIVGVCVHNLIDGDLDGFGVNYFGCGDCSDEDENAKPGQTGFFSTPHPGNRWFGGAGFDYNCNGRIEKEFNQNVPTCALVNDGDEGGSSRWVCPSSPAEGWLRRCYETRRTGRDDEECVSFTPLCGATTTWYRCVPLSNGTCTREAVGQRTQRCH